MLKKLLLTALLSASLAFAGGGMACEKCDANKSGAACEVNGTKCKHKDCKCGENCKCGDKCKCAEKKACDCNKTSKKAKKMKAKACEGNCSK